MQIETIHEDHEAEVVADLMKQNHFQGSSWCDMAVLARSNDLAVYICRQLKKRGVPVVLTKSQSVWDSAPGQVVEGYLLLAEQLGTHAALMRVLNKPSRGLGAPPTAAHKHAWCCSL